MFKEKTGKERRCVSGSVFSTAFSSNFDDIKKIVKKHLLVLHHDEILSEIVGTGVKIVVKRNKTLGDILSPSVFLSRPYERTCLSQRVSIGAVE